jgi:hypothetical protein
MLIKMLIKMLFVIVKLTILYIVGITGYFVGKIIFEKLKIRGKTGYRKYYWKDTHENKPKYN